MEHVLSKVNRSDVQTYPFPYVFIENAISDDLCDALIKTFPDNNTVAQGAALGDNARFSLSAPFVFSSDTVSQVWKDFIQVHSSDVFFDSFAYLFEDQIKSVYPDLFKTDGKFRTGIRNKDSFDNADVLLDAQICINTPVVSNPSSVKIAHIDDTDKLYAGLFYLRHPDDNSTGGNLQIYKTKDKSYKIHGPRLVDDSFVEVVKEIPYKKNSLILFLNSPLALHGVTVRSKTPHTRKFMNLVAEVKEPLFNIEKYRENFFDKVSRKLVS